MRTNQGEFRFMGWGGKRKGAGRKPSGARAGVAHARRARWRASEPAHVTLRLARGLPTLRAKRAFAIVRGALVDANATHRMQVVECSVQANHLHLLIEAPNGASMSSGMNGLVVRLARRLNRLWKRMGRVFPDRYHSRALKTPREVRNALVYVLGNARKHGAWFGAEPDPFSSGASFDGWKRNVAESSSRWLSRARTWLLNIGWRRHGLLDLAERPRS
jgi:REP element-mobilizing transposase RayT